MISAAERRQFQFRVMNVASRKIRQSRLLRTFHRPRRIRRTTISESTRKITISFPSSSNTPISRKATLDGGWEWPRTGGLRIAFCWRQPSELLACASHRLRFLLTSKAFSFFGVHHRRRSAERLAVQRVSNLTRTAPRKSLFDYAEMFPSLLEGALRYAG